MSFQVSAYKNVAEGKSFLAVISLDEVETPHVGKYTRTPSSVIPLIGFKFLWQLSRNTRQLIKNFRFIGSAIFLYSLLFQVSVFLAYYTLSDSFGQSVVLSLLSL